MTLKEAAEKLLNNAVEYNELREGSDRWMTISVLIRAKDYQDLKNCLKKIKSKRKN